MADDVRGSVSPKNEPTHEETKDDANEDAETRAARRELKQSTISDRTPQSTHTVDGSENNSPGVPASTDDKVAGPATPENADAPEAHDEELKDQVGSPKKKRAHDQLDGEKRSEGDDARSVASTDSAKGRASRLEPEKKRHRDGETAEPKTKHEEPPSTTQAADSSKSPTTTKTSTSAFAASSFGKLAAGSSPFASLGGATKGSVFGSSGNTSSTSFASVPATSSNFTTPAISGAAPPKLTFGGGGSGASPFGVLSPGSNGLAGASTFGSALSGAGPRQSFAAPGSKFGQSEKPARPFGAPESDADGEDEDDDDGHDEPSSEDLERAASPEKESDSRKKLKLQKVAVNDGEAGEATIASVRAKMFYHDKEAGWKERGAGMLKINVPHACVDFDDEGVAVPGTFDASGLEADEDDSESGPGGSKICRLIMRQDQTHRVILNTALVPAMQFRQNASLKSVGILFTAFEGEDAKPVSITMRMSAANAKTFMNEIDTVQRELRGN